MEARKLSDVELCEKMGIEPDYSKAIGRPLWPKRYPAGDALLKALKEKLREKEVVYYIVWNEEEKHCAAVEGNTSFGYDTELDALKAAITAMLEGGE